MIYGDIYSIIPESILSGVSGIKSQFFLKCGKIYFKIFGYPDVASFGRFPKVLRMLNPQKNEKIFDAGCGNGIYANSIAYHFGSKMLGCDLDKKRIRIAQKIANYLKVDAKFSFGEIEKINLPKNYFDKIICIEVIEHIKNDDLLIKKFNTLLKDNGALILSTAKKEELTEQEEQERFGKAEKGEHVRSGYELSDLLKKIENAGFKIVDWQPFYRFFSKVAIKIQQKIYKRNLIFLNLLTFPLFLLIAKLDLFIPSKMKWNNNFGWYRGFIIKAIKE